MKRNEVELVQNNIKKSRNASSQNIFF